MDGVEHLPLGGEELEDGDAVVGLARVGARQEERQPAPRQRAVPPHEAHLVARHHRLQGAAQRPIWW